MRIRQAAIAIIILGLPAPGLIPIPGNFPAPTHAQTSIFSEDFEAAIEPALPASVASVDATWTTSTSSESPGSGGNNLRHAGTLAGDVVFGPIDLTRASAVELSYLARRTASYPADSLIVSVSRDGGASWSIVVGIGAGLPAASSTYETISAPISDSLVTGASIFLRFRGIGGSSSGSNIRIDDILLAGAVDLSGLADTFGFGAAPDSVQNSAASISLPLDLTWTGTDSVQGLQFDASWDESLLSLTGVSRAPAVSDPAAWTLDFTTGADSSRILLFGQSGGALAPGVWSDLLSLQFSPVDTTLTADSTTTIDLGGLIASAHSDQGTGLSVGLSPATHDLTLLLSRPSISLAADTLSVGSVAVGATATATLPIANPTGRARLSVSGLTFASPPDTLVLSASPQTFSVPVGGSVDVEFTYAPTATDFGAIEAAVTLSHDAPSGSSTVIITGTGTGGRGDAGADGVVDVADVTTGIDAVLGRTPASPILSSADVHPYPAGNGAIDVRDLTVLVHAILNDAWPDGLTLPAAAPPVAAPAAGKRSAASVVQSGKRLVLKSNVALRAVQLRIAGLTAEPALLNGAHKLSPTLIRQSRFDSAAGTYHLMLAGAETIAGPVADGTGSRAGTLSAVLPLLEPVAPIAPEQIEYAVGVTTSDTRIALEVAAGRASTTAEQLPGAVRLTAQLYPNPVRRGQAVTFSLEHTEGVDAALLDELQLEMMDVLGRRLQKMSFGAAPAGRVHLDAAPLLPGVYFIRLTSGSWSKTLPLVVVQ